MFRNILTLLFRLIVKPASEWKILYENQKNEDENFYKNYLFPIIGLIALLSFIGALIDKKDLQLALKLFLKQILIYGGGFYVASFMMLNYLFPHFGLKKSKLLAEQFTAYASSVLFVIAMFEFLFIDFFLVKFFIFYTVYIIWIGASEFLNIQEDRLIEFTFFASVLILLASIFIRFLIICLMPGMKV